MKRITQANVRKVYGSTMQPVQQQQHHDSSQINAVRKIHNLLSSGAVTVTGPSQSRILKQKIGSSVTATLQNNPTIIPKCYVCDDPAGNQPTYLVDAVTATSNTKLTSKIAQILGIEFLVLIHTEDIVCKRCLAMINHLDRLEADSDRVKKNVLNYLSKKYNLDDDGTSSTISPPVKTQRLNSSNRKVISPGEDQHDNLTRKIPLHNMQTTRDSFDNQLSNVFETTEIQNRQQVNINQTKSINQQINIQQQNINQQQNKKGVRIFKCLSCDFKTTDYKQFQPHYDMCKHQSGFQCKTCKKLFSNSQALKQHITEKHPENYSCEICNTNFLNELTLKKHVELNHPEMKIVESIPQQISTSTLYSCNMCQYKTTDKQNYEEHQKKHIKLKPYKCRLCSLRFETRDQASVHAKSHPPNFFKCGTCSVSFPQREQLVKHFETHQTQNKIQQQQQQQQNQNQAITTQKLLQDSIDEALREPAEGLEGKNIQFLTCNICSLTFLQDNYYLQHMETHNRDNKKSSTTSESQNMLQQETNNSHAAPTTQSSTISEADIESMFERMHSENKLENTMSTSAEDNENLVISQENSVGGITFNITIPQENTEEKTVKLEEQPPTTSTSDSVSVGIDMPVLDEPIQPKIEVQQTSPSDNESKNQIQTVASVSMPSLDDEGDSQSQPSNTDQIPMELDDIQNSVESGQIKFILNDNGQLIQLDSHQIITDADGNQILVQGTDSEQLQQLLQSVGVLQTTDGLDGETLQMIGENNQMIIVQQGDNEPQLIDASLLNSDGHIVIQQAQDGDMHEGAHVPVSMAFATHEQNIHLDTSNIEHQQQNEGENQQQKDEIDKKNDEQQQEQQHQNGISSEQNVIATTQSLQTSTGETFFALEDLMQQPEQKSSE